MFTEKEAPLVEVIWNDAAHEAGWIMGNNFRVWLEDSIDSKYITRTLGYMLAWTDKKIIVAQTQTESGVSETMDIPMPIVQEVRVLRTRAVEYKRERDGESPKTKTG